MTDASRKWFLRQPSLHAKGRLFLFPYSGCGASMFRSWPQWLDDVEVLPLQLPGRENRMREPHFGTYEALADAAADDLERYLDRPYGVFGHCGGALPAFETVLRFEERGFRSATRCFVSSQVAPQDGPYGRFLGMSSVQLRGELAALLAAMGSAHPPADLLDMVLEVLEADLDANRAYRRKTVTRTSTPVTAIGWDSDTEVPRELMTGWDSWSVTDRVIFPGDHYSFLKAPSLLLDRLRRDLAVS